MKVNVSKDGFEREMVNAFRTCSTGQINWKEKPCLVQAV